MDEKYYCAVKALIFRDDNFLIIKRSLNARSDPHSWEFPGGRIEFKESPETAIDREVKEETSLDVNCLFPISTWTFTKTENIQVIGITFLCLLRQPGTVVLSPEHDEFAWISESQIGNFQFSKGVTEEMKKWNWDFVKKLKIDLCKTK
jgi:8-oxo-dGTP diphosphatase